MTRRAIHIHPQVGPDLPPGLMPDLWGFGAGDERARARVGHPRPTGQEHTGPIDRIAHFIHRIGKLFG